MDKSKEYVKMCEKAMEIQKIRQSEDAVNRGEWWKRGDFIYDKDNEYIFTVCGIRHCTCDTGYFNEENIVWLPRQDQLQEMLASHSVESCFDFFDRYYNFLDDKYRQYLYELPIDFSMEMFWLLIVMVENYDKKWNGKDWINEET